MNYYKRHLGDYAKKTKMLTTYEHGVYNQILDQYYIEESPGTTEDAYVLCRAESSKERASVDKVLAKYFELIDEVWRHSRADEEIEKYRQKAEKNRAIGSLGGKQNAKRNASETLSESLQKRLANDNPSHKPLANSHKKAKEGPADADLFPGIDSRVVEDFKALRKAKKAVITETALEGIRREAEKAGYTFERALRTCCERGWVGFKADWVGGQESAQASKAAQPGGGRRAL